MVWFCTVNVSSHSRVHNTENDDLAVMYVVSSAADSGIWIVWFFL